LQSGQFPEAVFLPDHVKGRVASSGDSQIEVHGSMRIHGGEHDTTIPVKISLQKDRVTATAKFVLPYVAWGLKDPSNLVLRVDKTVNIEVALNGSVATRSGESSVVPQKELAKATVAAAAISR
jgi:YceI-like domain